MSYFRGVELSGHAVVKQTKPPMHVHVQFLVEVWLAVMHVRPNSLVE